MPLTQETKDHAGCAVSGSTCCVAVWCNMVSLGAVLYCSIWCLPRPGADAAQPLPAGPHEGGRQDHGHRVVSGRRAAFRRVRVCPLDSHVGAGAEARAPVGSEGPPLQVQSVARAATVTTHHDSDSISRSGARRVERNAPASAARARPPRIGPPSTPPPRRAAPRGHIGGARPGGGGAHRAARVARL